MTAPVALAEVARREAKGHGRGSSGKGNGGQEARGGGSKATLEPGRELGPGHWDGEERDCGAGGGDRVGEDQGGRKKVTQSPWTWIRGRVAEAFVM